MFARFVHVVRVVCGVDALADPTDVKDAKTRPRATIAIFMRFIKCTHFQSGAKAIFDFGASAPPNATIVSDASPWKARWTLWICPVHHTS